MLLIFLYILASTEAYGTLETRVYDTYDMYSQGYGGFRESSWVNDQEGGKLMTIRVPWPQEPSKACEWEVSKL